MDPLSAISSVAGIMALGITLSDILQKHSEIVVSAPERLKQIVLEISTTAHGVQDLNFLDL